MNICHQINSLGSLYMTTAHLTTALALLNPSIYIIQIINVISIVQESYVVGVKQTIVMS